MMKKCLDQLVALLPPDVKHPAPEELAIIRRIDHDIDIRRAEIERLLEVEAEVLDDILFAHEEPYSALSGILFANSSRHPFDIQTEHERRKTLLTELISAPCRLEDGGIKTRQRFFEKLDRCAQRGQKYQAVADKSRVRIVAPTLVSLDHAYHDLVAGMTREGYSQIEFRVPNYATTYNLAHRDSALSKTMYAMPLRAIFSYWIPVRPPGQPVTVRDRTITEVQLVTENTHSLLALSHPFEVSKCVPYPKHGHHRQWLFYMFLKAAVADVLEHKGLHASTVS